MRGENDVINNFHKTNMIMWAAVMSAIVIISIISYVFDQMQLIKPVHGFQEWNQIFFIIAVMLAFVILFFKRTFFVPQKIIDRAKKVQQADQVQNVLSSLRRDYIVVWAIGELICILGFVNYILIVQLNNFLIYAVVSLYAVAINIPRIGLVQKCVEVLSSSK